MCTRQQITALESIFTEDINANDVYCRFKTVYNDIFNEYLDKIVRKQNVITYAVMVTSDTPHVRYLS